MCSIYLSETNLCSCYRCCVNYFIIHSHSGEKSVNLSLSSVSRKSQRYVFYLQLPASHAGSRRGKEGIHIIVIWHREGRDGADRQENYGHKSDRNAYITLDDTKNTLCNMSIMNRYHIWDLTGVQNVFHLPVLRRSGIQLGKILKSDKIKTGDILKLPNYKCNGKFTDVLTITVQVKTELWFH